MSPLREVRDISFEEAAARSYDLSWFGCGYEPRCIFVPAKLDVSMLGEVNILAFEDFASIPQRVHNERILVKRLDGSVLLERGASDGVVLERLRAVASRRGVIRVLVDYSSMSRLWYGAMLRWANSVAATQMPVEIDLLYSVGMYGGYEDHVGISEILTMPGFDGSASRGGRSVAVFGLGFSGLLPLAVFDQIEPEMCYAIVADPASSADFLERTMEANKEFIDNNAKELLRLPLASVARSFARLVELAASHGAHEQITFIGMGPKPHVLAMLLAALRVPQVACLRVAATRSASEAVSASGEVVCTRVAFE